MSILSEPFRIRNKVVTLFEIILGIIPFFRFFRKTKNDEYPITFNIWYNQKYKGVNGSVYWPVHPSSLVKFHHKVIIGKHSYPGYQPGCFINGSNGIVIGDYSYFATNVGLMSSNHDVHDLRNLISTKPIEIGNYNWIGMNSVILPGVHLGDFTIVGAGSVVTKSFKEGHCIIAGNPAKIIRRLDPAECVKYEKNTYFMGYLSISEFKNRKEQILKNIWSI